MYSLTHLCTCLQKRIAVLKELLPQDQPPTAAGGDELDFEDTTDELPAESALLTPAVPPVQASAAPAAEDHLEL